MPEVCTSCGASHYGEGGLGNGHAVRNPVYGSFITEEDYLSGAGSSGTTPGGGAIILDTEVAEVHGIVTAR